MAKKKPEWNELPCPFCREPAKVDAVRCPHCTAEFSREQIQQRMRTHQQTKKGCLIALAVVALSTLAVCAVTRGEGDQAPPVASAPSPAPKAVASPADQAAARRDVVQSVRQLLAAGAECDAAYNRAVEGLSNNDLFAAYSAATEGRDICQRVSSTIGDIEAPETAGSEKQAQLAEAFDTCRDAYFMRSMALDTLSEALDGNMRPSKVEEFRQHAEGSQSGIFACVGGVMGPATELGATGDDLKL